ncbi:phosphoglycerate dehydrogenase, partial [Escherichia coli]|nr:phosphoglycerate dehydrogenase [Escherichia coli]
LRTAGNVGYVVIDVTTQTKAQAELVLQKLKGLPGTIRARMLY